MDINGNPHPNEASSELAGMKALFLGGAGFIGSNCAALLQKKYGMNCTIADLYSEKPKIAFGNMPLNFHHLDVSTDKEEMARLIADTDVVINLASIVCPKNYVDNPLGVFDLNIMHGIDIIRECVRHKKRLIHFSTSEVYGKTSHADDFFNEDTSDCITGPIHKSRWIYSTCKQLLDRVIFAHGQRDGLRFTILRPFNVIGGLYDYYMEDQSDGCPRVLAQFSSALINGEPLQIVDGGASLRCFTDVDDLSEAVALVLKSPEQSDGQIYNVGIPENEISVVELARMMTKMYCRLTGTLPENIPSPHYVSSAVFYGSGYEDMTRRLPDVTKLRGLGWTPRFDLEHTVQKTLQFVMAHRKNLTQDHLFGQSYGSL